MSNGGATRRLRLGIIGCGLAVKYLHWPALKQLQDKFQVVLVCDTDPQAAQALVELIGQGEIAYTADYKTVLASDQVEAVLSSLPIELSATVMMDSIRAGKHIIGEKPLAGDWAEALELVKVTQANRTVVVEVAENFHYRPDFMQARQWIKEGRLGNVFLIETRGHIWTDPTVSFAQTHWRQRDHVKYRGGVFADAVVHHAAGLRELGGEIVQVQAFVKSTHAIMAPVDTVVVNVLFKSGALGSIIYTGSARINELEFFSATVFGDKATLLLEDSGRLRFQQMGLPDQVIEPNPAIDKNGYYQEFVNFWEAIVEGAPVVGTPEQALLDWEIIMKALDSAESGQVIPF
jgi:predicted dehydrogenase